MSFILTGFSQDSRFRVFRFEHILKGSDRTEYRVKADLGLLQKYRIRIQELPLLCRRFLELRSLDGGHQTFTYSEAEMSQHAAVDAPKNQKKYSSPSLRARTSSANGSANG